MALSREEQVLQAILNDDRYKHFKEVGQDDWRDGTRTNASLSLSTKGWCDHKTGESGSNYDFVATHNIPLPDHLTQAKDSQKVRHSYEKYSHNGAEEMQMMVRYFKTRGLEVSVEYLSSIGLKVNRYKEKTEIVAPIYDVKGLLCKLYRIPLNDDCSKAGKSLLLGKSNHDHALLFGDMGADTAYVFEGLEDAMAFDLHTGGAQALIVTGGATHFKKCAEVLEQYPKTTIILDPDENKASMIGSAPLGNKYRRVVPANGIDCNQAVMDHKFDEWMDSWQEVPFSMVEDAVANRKKEKSTRPVKPEDVIPADALGKLEHEYGTQLTEMGLAERLVIRHGKALKHCDQLGGWHVWDGQRWAVDLTYAANHYAKKTVRSLYQEASKLDDPQKAKAITTVAIKSERQSVVGAILALAKAEPDISVSSDEFDDNKHLLNFENGLYDLDKGTFTQENKQHHMITKKVHANYTPDAGCPRWRKFIKEITCGDIELERYLQRAVGYSLSGYTNEEVLFFLYGGGKNGKSTLTGTIERIFDEYTARIGSDRIAKGKGSSIPNDLAQLRGARIAISTEIAEDMFLDEAKVKEMTGNDKVSARFLHGNLFEYLPQFKLWLYGNHKPVIKGGNDLGIWRRMQLIPFNFTVARVDGTLKDYLFDVERDGIVQWAIEGFDQWRRKGLQPPQVVIEATKQYQSESDITGQFIEARCMVKKGSKVDLTTIFTEYAIWAEEAGVPVATKIKFAQMMSERGFSKTLWLKREPASLYKKNVLRGVRLKSEKELGVEGEE